MVVVVVVVAVAVLTLEFASLERPEDTLGKTTAISVLVVARNFWSSHSNLMLLLSALYKKWIGTQ